MSKVDIEKILELEAKATRENWQTRFIYRMFVSARADDSLFQETEACQDWPDADLIAVMRNNIVPLCDELKSARDKIAKLEKVVKAVEKLGPPSDHLISGWDLAEVFEALKEVGEK